MRFRCAGLQVLGLRGKACVFQESSDLGPKSTGSLAWCTFWQSSGAGTLGSLMKGFRVQDFGGIEDF